MKVQERAPRTGVIWSGSTTVRVRPLASQPGHGVLLITGSHASQLSLPETDTLADWLDTLREWGYTHIRTSAVSPLVADRLHDIGFTTVQDLVLLHRDMNQQLSVNDERDSDVSTFRFRPWVFGSKKSDISQLLDIDRLGFGDEWCMDSKSFDDAVTATQHTKIFTVRHNKHVDGFIIVGVSGQNAFIQRLAVHPRAQRTGVASQLLLTALQWIQKKKCSRVVVNTELLNHAAISLYSKFDFQNMEHGLEVLERSLA